jgi:hypothetical protein
MNTGGDWGWGWGGRGGRDSISDAAARVEAAAVGAAARAAGTAGCYGGSLLNDSMLHTFSGVCLRSNPEALHTSVSFCPCAVLSSAQHLPKRSVSLITHARRPGAQVHAPQLEGPAHWMVLYPSLNNDSIFLSMLRPHPLILILQKDLILKRTEK